MRVSVLCGSLLLLLLVLSRDCSSSVQSSSLAQRSDGVDPALVPSLDLLLRVLKAMDRALDFMAGQSRVLNLDGVIGLRMVDDQLSVFLSRFGRILWVSGSTAKRRLLSETNSLRWKARSAAEESIPQVRKNQRRYFDTLGVLLKEGQWALDYPVRTLPEVQAIVPPPAEDKVLLPLVETYSDACVHELVGSSSPRDVPTCNVSDYCWDLMTSPDYVGYALTHQVFYLEIGQMSGCSRDLERLSRVGGRGNVSALQDTLCARILREARDIQENLYPERSRDLLMEQVALCGVLGYREFLNEDWLRTVLSWQDISGCYTRPEFREDAVAASSDGGRRRKREDKKLKGSCSSHKTSVALGSLVVSARFLLQAIAEGAAVFL